ncbi:MAG: hypothetical protein K2Q06_11775 [Parvularculaceae bacterium]|nr:hypothetical protein [Parvularculaceae bacterium]
MFRRSLGLAVISFAVLGTATAAPFGQLSWRAASGGDSARAATESPGLLEWLRTFLMFSDEGDASAGAAVCKDEAQPASAAPAAPAPAKKPVGAKAPAGAVGMQKAPQPLPLAF